MYKLIILTSMLFLAGCMNTNSSDLNEITSVELDLFDSYGDMSEEEINNSLLPNNFKLTATYRPKTQIPFVNSSLEWCNTTPWFQLTPRKPCFTSDSVTKEIIPKFNGRKITLDINMYEKGFYFSQVHVMYKLGDDLKWNRSFDLSFNNETSPNIIEQPIALGGGHRGFQGISRSKRRVSITGDPTNQDYYWQLKDKILYDHQPKYARYADNVNIGDVTALKQLPKEVSNKYKSLSRAYYSSKIRNGTKLELISILTHTICENLQSTESCDYDYEILFADGKLVSYKHSEWNFEDKVITTTKNYLLINDDGSVKTYGLRVLKYSDSHDTQEDNHIWSDTCTMDNDNYYATQYLPPRKIECNINKPSKEIISGIEADAKKVKSWFNTPQ